MVAVLIASVVVIAAIPTAALAKSGDSQKNGLSRLAALKKKPGAGTRVTATDASCQGAPVRDFGAGAVCADTGFRRADILRFGNWGGVGQYKTDDYLGPEFVAAFGADNVCASVTGNSCVLTKSAAENYATIRDYIGGGRCEGIILVAALMNLGWLQPSSLIPSASRSSAIRPNDPTVLRNINYWWSTQFDQNVLKATGEIRDSGVQGIVQMLGSNLRSGIYGTMGIYSGKSGHAVLPVALLRDVSGSYAAVVYDSNTPGKFGRVLLDPAAGTWSYPLPGLGGSPKGWSGKSGTIDLTPMSSRPRTATCSFCGGKDASTTTVKTGPERVYAGSEILK